MGNDVFFYNDKSGRVERINNGKAEPSSSSYSSLMESMITSDAQQSAHDSAWLRRPRSKYSRWDIKSSTINANSFFPAGPVQSPRSSRVRTQ